MEDAKLNKLTLDEASKDENFKQKLRRLLEEYVAQVLQSDLSEASKSMYIGNAEYFVQWVHGDVRTGRFGARARRGKPFKE
jgi:hypothetical protein